MTRAAGCLAMVLGLLALPAAGWAQEAVTDPEVLKGISQVEDGEYDAAIFTLDTAARRLAADPEKARDMSQAYLYLGIAYFGKGHEAAAKAKFRDALKQFRDISLSAEQYPPAIINLFEAAREETRTAPPAAPAATAAAAPAATAAAVPEEKKGGGGKKGLLIGAAAVLVGGGVAVAAAGGGDGGEPESPMQERTFTGTLTVGHECQDWSLNVMRNGTLEANVEWSTGEVEFELCFYDNPNWEGERICGNRLTDRSAQLIRPVGPGGKVLETCYWGPCLETHEQTGETCPASFTVHVRYP